jgi:predicted transcriptional regulator
MPGISAKKNLEQVATYADMFSAMGTEARLRIMQLLLSAHPEDLVVGEIQEELDIPNSTCPTIWASSGMKVSKFAAKALSFGTQQIRRLYKSCCNSFMASAALETRHSKARDIVQICKKENL